MQGLEALDEQLLQQRAEVGNTLSVGVLEHSAEGGDVGQALQPKQALDEGIVAIGLAFTELAVAEEQMDYQLEEED